MFFHPVVFICLFIRTQIGLLQSEPIPVINKANWKLYKKYTGKYSLPCVDNINKEDFDAINEIFLCTIESTIKNEDIFPLKDKIFIQNKPIKSIQTEKLEQCIHNYDKRLRQQTGNITTPQKSLKQDLYKKLKERKSYNCENHYQGIAVSISGSMKTNKFWDKINKSKGNHTNYL